MNVAAELAGLVGRAVEEAQSAGVLPEADVPEPLIERSQKPDHGDYACSLPLKLARPMRMRPTEIAQSVVDRAARPAWLERVWAAPPGFINFELSGEWLARQAGVIRAAGASFGDVPLGRGRRVQVEFVSVNPTGPLHVGHARGAVFGSALANLLEAAGYQVQREYYVNDAGNQMELFNRSLYARYLQAFGHRAELPSDGYQGEYLTVLAEDIKEDVGDRFLPPMEEGAAVREMGEMGLRRMLAQIRADMEGLRIGYDVWFSERSLLSGGQFARAMSLLRDAGYLVDREGATWFRSTALGDDRDKVVVRGTGAPTYFATDVAYHFDKFFERGFDRVIDVLGADHQGHVSFMKAMASAIGVAPERLDLLIYQLVTLKRGGETVRLSKRAGDLITVRELVEEVGADACRFFFLSRAADSQMDFDMELAKEESDKNPVYYVQYAHARISGILRLAGERGIGYDSADLSLLSHEAELALIRKMLHLPELVEQMAVSLAPHHLPHYAVELATAFHLFYQRCRVISGDPDEAAVTRARLQLVDAARVALARCLDLMSMEAPERM